MDFVSLSPSDDDLFRRDQDHYSSEANNFPIPETLIPVAQKPSRKWASSKSNCVSSMVRIPPGSSLLNIQDYHSSPDHTFVSPSPPPSAAKRGWGHYGTEICCRCSSPTPSPPRGEASRLRSDNTGRTTCWSQCHHAPVRSLDRPSSKKKKIIIIPNFHISPLGIATRKYSGKKLIVIDLSAPHSSVIPKQ